MKVAAVGANPGTSNIGHVIAEGLRKQRHTVTEHSPSTTGFYGPDIDFTGYSGLVVATGHVLNEKIGEFDLLQTSIDTNLTAAMGTVNAFVRDTVKVQDRRKKIVLIGSMAHRKVLTGMSAYCAAKAGLDMFTKCAAFELGPKGYDVYVVHPGSVASTPMAGDMVNQMAEAKGLSVEDAYKQWHDSSMGANGQMTTTADISEVVNVLFKKNMVMLSGTAIEINGGQR